MKKLDIIYASKAITLILCSLIFCLSCDDKKNGGGGTDAVEIKVSLQELSVDEGEETSNKFVRLRLNEETQKLFTVYLTTTDGTAEAGTDYVEVDNAPIVFQPGDKNKDFKIQIIGDSDFEEDEYFNITIVNLEGDATIEVETVRVTILNDEKAPSNFTIPTTGTTSSTSYMGMNLMWSDEFDGTSVKSENWTFELGNGDWGWGNNELQYYQRENAKIVDGHLVIEAREDDNGKPYTSSRMITKGKYDFQYGRVDIRAALPKGQGIWPALWMLGSNISTVGWPACGEVDIMELLGHQPNKMYGTAHWSNNSQPAKAEGHKTLSGTRTFHDDFHVFSVIWTDTSIRWLLDDVQYHQLNITGAGLNELTKSQFFIFNVAVGGRWPGSPDATTTFPQHMIVDYIRVFQ